MTTSPSLTANDEGAPAPLRTCACSHAADDGAGSQLPDDGADTTSSTAEAARLVGAGGPSRRHVLAGLGAIGAAATLAACANSSQPAGTTEPAADAGNGSPGALAKVADVPVGGAIATQLDGAPVIIAQPEAGTFVGLSAICTHQGCTVAPDGAGLVCPCHGSTFTLAGEVGQGPATENLVAFDVTVEGDDLVAAI